MNQTTVTLKNNTLYLYTLHIVHCIYVKFVTQNSLLMKQKFILVCKFFFIIIIIIIIYSANVKNNNKQIVQKIIRFNKTGNLNTR